MEPVRVEFLMVDGMSARLSQAGAKVDALKGKARAASSEMDSLGKVSERVRTAVSSVVGAFAAKELAGKIANVRGEFQQLEAAFTTMLGSADKANALMAQLTETAATTPFGLQEVAQGAKQLLAYGTEAEKVNGTLLRLGDIAAGLSVPLGDLVYLYGTTMAQGRLYTQDLNQFTGRGIPMIQELAKQFGVAESEVKGLVEEGKVGFPEVEKVIESLTDEGGKFGGLMEAQSRTITGQISNIEDSFETMLNKMGQENEGVINTALGGVSSLLENYEQVGRLLLSVAALYGTYKTAVMAVNAVVRLNAAYEAASAVAARANAISHTNLSGAVVLARKAVAGLNTTMLANPYVLLATAVVGTVVAVKNLCDKYGDATWRAQEYEGEVERLNRKYEAQKTKVSELLSVARDEKKTTDERAQAVRELRALNPDYFKDLDVETAKLYGVAEAQAAVVRQQREAVREKAKGTIHEYNVAARKYKSRYGVDHGATVASVSRNTSVSGPDVAGMERVREKKELDEMRLAALAAQRTLEEMAKKGKAKETKETKETKEEKETKGTKGTIETGEARKKAAAKAGEELLALERENEESEIALMEEGREKKLRQIDEEYRQRAAEIETKAHELAEANKKAGETNVNVNGLTEAQQAEIDKANELNEKNKAKQESDLVKADAEAMRAYLKQYGTYQQQKLAIAEEYAAKIRQAESEGAKKTLEAERDSALRAVDVESIKQSVDWGSVFGDFGTLFKDQLRPTIEKLRALASSESFKSGSLEDQRTLYELIAKLEQSGAVWDGDIFKKVSADITAYQQAMKGYTAAMERERAATEKLAAAQERLATAGTGEDKTAAQQEVDAAQAALGSASAEVRTFGGQVAETTESLRSSSEQARNMFESLSQGLQGLGSGSLKGAWQGATTLDKLFGGDLTEQAGVALAKGIQGLLGKDSAAAQVLSEALGESGMAGEIISAVLGVLDLIAEEGISGIVTGLQDAVLGSVSKILEDVLSGDIIVKPVENAVSTVGDMLDTLTFGGFSSWTGGNGKELARTIERLTGRNETLVTAIDDLRDTIEHADGLTMEEKSESYAQAVENQKEVNANYLEMAKAQAGYHGSHHSWSHYWGGFTDAETEWIKENVKSDFGGDLFELTPEEMKALRSNVGIWERIAETGKGGYGERLTEKLDDYIEQAYAVEELTDEWAEELTGVSFDSLYDEWLSTLEDMDSDASDFADNFSEYMFKAMLQTWANDNLKGRLESWYKAWAAFSDDGLSEVERQMLENGGTYTDSEGNTVSFAGTAQMAEESLAARDSIAEATGYEGDSGTSQTGQSGGFTAMTQDQGTKLEGMFTSGLQHWSSMDSRLEDVAARMDVAEGHLAAIAQNTGLGASHLNEIKEDLKKVIRDGLKMK